MRRRVNIALLPEQRIMVQFDFHGAAKVSFWLILTRADVTICLTDPGYEINVLVTADLAAYYKLWAGRINYLQALRDFNIQIDGAPSMVRAFPDWFGWNVPTSVPGTERVLNGIA